MEKLVWWGFSAFISVKLIFFFRAVMILKIKGRGVSKAPTGTWGRAPSSCSALLSNSELFRGDFD